MLKDINQNRGICYLETWLLPRKQLTYPLCGGKSEFSVLAVLIFFDAFVTRRLILISIY